ncbi:hypothetical protein BDW02DRAFT_534828 [Decorospora gaudefroyi]|uniref:Gfd2/YDR514C-like C-terminal domain-containing protein n=1 Tax=Decorospora gaudefroyi TaxID=184978 RepID=A0A6A5K9P0_9PLEO|nr:hypothetical protein BDW02DRAFT_534828 [Decorospora gaudefroyi]
MSRLRLPTAAYRRPPFAPALFVCPIANSYASVSATAPSVGKQSPSLNHNRPIMVSSARLERLRNMLKADLEALPDRPISPPAEPNGASDELPVPASKQSPSNQTDMSTKEAQPAANANADRRFVWAQDAESSFNPNLDSMRLSSTPPDTAEPAVTDLQRGDLAPAHHHYTPILALAKYPYKYCSKNHAQDIASAFFDQGKFWKRKWDLYYVWDIDASKPLTLVRERQVHALLKEINSRLKLNLRITDHQREEGLVARFPNHPRCLPRYLGRSHSRDDHDNMAGNAPDESFRAAGEASHPPLLPPTLEEFKQMMQDLQDAQKAKGKANKAKKLEQRLDKHKAMADQFKRAQRYLGLRPTVPDGQAPPGLPAAIDPSMPAPFMFDQSVVFVCVDVESYERAHHKITEIGVATLDTRDLVGVAPGENGAAWREKIRARHFRINEYRHLHNSVFVNGHPDGFEFGESTFIPLSEAANHVAACFHAPFGAHATEGGAADNHLLSKCNPTEMRNIIFLGHDTLGDIRYLQQLGYDPSKVENILESMDTAIMYRVWHRDEQITKLGKILADFDIIGWKLHNAGNDAVYTVQAMLGICVREATIRGSPELEDLRNEEKTARLKAALEEAHQKAQEDAAGWSDHEADGDGGAPVPLAATDVPKPLSVQNKPKAIPQYDGSFDLEDGRGIGRGRARARGGPARSYPVRGDNQRGRGQHVSNGYRGSDERGTSRGSWSVQRRAGSPGRARSQVAGRGRGRGRGLPDSDGLNAANTESTPPSQCHW